MAFSASNGKVGAAPTTATIVNPSTLLLAKLAPGEGGGIAALDIHWLRAGRECWIILSLNRKAPMYPQVTRKARRVAVRPEANGCPHGAHEIIEVARVHGGGAVPVLDDWKSPTPKERADATPIAWGHIGNLDRHVRQACQQHLPLTGAALYNPELALLLVGLLIRPRIIFCYTKPPTDWKKHAPISICAVTLTLR